MLYIFEVQFVPIASDCGHLASSTFKREGVRQREKEVDFTSFTNGAETAESLPPTGKAGNGNKVRKEVKQ